MKLKNIKINFKIFLLSFVVFFFILLFFIDKINKIESYDIKDTVSYVWSDNSYTWILEKNFDDIEKSLWTKDKYELILKTYKNQIKQKQELISNTNNINFLYIPNFLEENITKTDKFSYLNDLIYSKLFKKFNFSFDIQFLRENTTLRARYKNNIVKIYNINSFSNEEFLSIFIHELWHYFDVKYLEKKVFSDLSNDFYNISWIDIKILKNGSDKDDFVSWYAMTNKYEDFSETFTYYILYNDDFRRKLSKSDILEKKYNFFSKYIFKNDEFKKTNFRFWSDFSDYIRDTTKIKFSVKNFLEYLKNWI